MLGKPWRIPCEGAPCPREVFFAEGLNSKLMIETCENGLKDINEKFQEQMSKSGMKPPNTKKRN